MSAPDGWQPIETAPRDGTTIIAFVCGQVVPACWECVSDDDMHVGWCGMGSRYGGILYDLHYQLEGSPTHWMPLPPAPVTA